MRMRVKMGMGMRCGLRFGRRDYYFYHYSVWLTVIVINYSCSE